jgi:hypothetical protein
VEFFSRRGTTHIGVLSLMAGARGLQFLAPTPGMSDPIAMAAETSPLNELRFHTERRDPIHILVVSLLLLWFPPLLHKSHRMHSSTHSALLNFPLNSGISFVFFFIVYF